MGQQTVYDDFPHNAGISRWQWVSSLSLTVPRLRFFFPSPQKQKPPAVVHWRLTNKPTIGGVSRNETKHTR